VARPFGFFWITTTREGARSCVFCKGGHDAVCTMRFSRKSKPAPQAASWTGGPPFENRLPVPVQRVPPLAFFARAGIDAADTMGFAMPSGLHRTYGAHHLHFITCSCYRRLPFLKPARSRDRFLAILEQARKRYRFVIVGYVVMPEHIHLLMTEPEIGSPSTVMQVLKQRTAWSLLPRRNRKDPRQSRLFAEDSQPRSFWQARFYDFNVWTTKKRIEKLRYMHRNPVKRGLVQSPERWRWSSYRFYSLGEEGAVRVNVGWGEISFRGRVA